MTNADAPAPTRTRRVLIVLTYYRPHVSGLTIYVERLARELARRGHTVTVLTSRYDRSLAALEELDGVRVVRVPVLARVSKGVLMPLLPWAVREARRHDAVSIHLPQLDGGLVAVVSRVLRRPTVLTYHCDLRLPRGAVNRVADRVVQLANWVAAAASHRIVAYTQDYADHTPLLRRWRRKVRVIPPPVVMPAPSAADVADLRRRFDVGEGPVIGMAARLATEKGVEHLADAALALSVEHPGTRVLFAGPHDDVVGEGGYRRMLEPRLRALGDRWTFVGTLTPAEMPAFLGALDVLVVSSVNSTESFGLVQVEAMLCGTPVVATDLPGVRQPVRMTGMGAIAPPADASALALAIADVVANRASYVRPRSEVEAIFDISTTVDAYLDLVDEVSDG